MNRRRAPLRPEHMQFRKPLSISRFLWGLLSGVTRRIPSGPSSKSVESEPAGELKGVAAYPWFLQAAYYPIGRGPFYQHSSLIGYGR